MIHTIRTVQSLQNTTLHRYISARAAEDHTMAKGGSWSVLKHVTGRLLSYQYAVEVLVHAHHIWAETDLFHDFEIESVRSSSPYTVTKDLLNPTPESAEMILNRAPGTSQRKEDMKIQAKELEKYNLGSAFQQLWLKQVKEETKQIVHAEILLHSWLMATEGGVHKTRFFQGWQYIVSCSQSHQTLGPRKKKLSLVANATFFTGLIKAPLSHVHRVPLRYRHDPRALSPQPSELVP